jgi:hypothetical protein
MSRSTLSPCYLMIPTWVLVDFILALPALANQEEVVWLRLVLFVTFLPEPECADVIICITAQLTLIELCWNRKSVSGKSVHFVYLYRRVPPVGFDFGGAQKLIT